jgi:hypothetical protein
MMRHEKVEARPIAASCSSSCRKLAGQHDRRPISALAPGQLHPAGFEHEPIHDTEDLLVRLDDARNLFGASDFLPQIPNLAGQST